MSDIALTPGQNDILNLATSGATTLQISSKLNLDERIVNAQLTRIRNKGYNTSPTVTRLAEALYPESNVATQTKQTIPTIRTERGMENPQKETPRAPTSNDEIKDILLKSGRALTAEELEKLAAQVAGIVERDAHPMLLLGVTIQFVRLCGGRFTAHQVIEDTYAALATMVNDLPLNTVKWSKDDFERERLEKEVKQLQTDLREAQGKILALNAN